MRLKLFPRITLVFVAFAALLLGAFGAVVFIAAQNTLRRDTFYELFSAELEKEAALTSWIHDRQVSLGILAATLQQQDHIALLNGSDLGSAAAQQTHKELVAELQIWVNGGTFAELILVDANTGRVIVGSDPAEEGKFKDSAPFFINGRTGPYVQPPFYALNLQAPAMMVSQPIVSRDRRLQAVLAGRLNLTELSAIIGRHTSVHETTDAYLVNNSNLFVTQPRSMSNEAVLRRGNYTPAVARCLQGESGSTTEPDYRGVSVFAVYRWLADKQLCLIVQIDQSEAFAPVQNFTRTLIVVSSIALLGASLFALVLARSITHPIRRLQQGAARFGRGELEVRLPETSTDELGALAREFNTMAATLSTQQAGQRAYAADLEQRVHERTEDLARLNAELEQRVHERTEQLRQSEQKFAIAYRSSPDGITISKLAEGQIVDANEAYAWITGYRLDELIGRSVVELGLVPAAERLRITQLFSAQGFIRNLEFPMLSRSQQIVDVMISMEPIELNGEPCILTITHNITERKRVEQATLRRNAELAALNQMGQVLSRITEPAELLALIPTVVGQVLDNRHLTIVLYDESKQSISFPVYMIDGVHVPRPGRPISKGLVDHIISTRLPLFMPHDVQGMAGALGLEPHGPQILSFVGVPMIAGDKVAGVISLRDFEREDAFDSGHLDVLLTIAAQAAIAFENARLFAETRRRAEQLQTITEVEQAIITSLEPDKLMSQIARVVRVRLNLYGVTIALVEGNELVFKSGSRVGHNDDEPMDLRLKIGREGMAGRVAFTGQTMLAPDVSLNPYFHHSTFTPAARSALVVPLKTQSGVLGIIALTSDYLNAFNAELVALVETLAAQIAVAVENANLFEQTRRLARTDALTNLSNRRQLMEVGEREVRRAHRFHHPLAAIMLDIDHFKLVNDTHGHPVGDVVLQAVAACCLNATRETDLVGRYGGEEFVILSVETDLEGAHQLAERLRARVAAMEVATSAGPITVTLSAGVAILEPNGDLASLLSQADQSLYAAKHAGRNQVR